MAIRLISAMLAQGDGVDAEGKLHIIEPVVGFSYPAEQREQFRASGEPYAIAHLPPSRLVLLLWGGKEGQTIHITGSFGLEGEKKGTAVLNNKITWKEKDSFRLGLEFQGTINFSRTALYELRLLADGEPLAVVPIIVGWDDEVRL